jgi:glycosyltransferase involved in cell wall biosynthesis
MVGYYFTFMTFISKTLSALPARRMRVALVTEVADTGLGHLLESLARGLAERGHDVHFIYSAKRIDPDVLRRLEYAGITRKMIAMHRGPSLGDFASAWRLRRYLRENGPFDVVHGHSSKGGALARLAAAGLKVAQLYTPHAFYTLAPNIAGMERAMFRFAERQLSRLCNRIICSSQIEFDHARELGVAAEKLVVIPNGMASGELDPPRREELGIPADALLVGFVGRLESQKGPDIVLKALAWALRRNPRIHLAILGEGSLRQSLNQEAIKLGIADKIVWLGHKPVRHYIASFDLLLAPSRYEGFSLMPLEAMNAAIPILCSPVGGVLEAIVPGRTGLVLEGAPAFGAAILELAADPDRRRAMGAAARARLPLFTQDRMIGATEQLYAGLTEQTREGMAVTSVSRARLPIPFRRSKCARP